MAKAAQTSAPAAPTPVMADPGAPPAPVKTARKPRQTPKKRVAKKPSAKTVLAAKRVPQKRIIKKRKKRRPTEPVNKAQAIRDVAKKLGRKVRPRDIIAALAAKGITVSSPQVSMTLKSAGYARVRRGRKKAATAAVVTGAPGTEFSIVDLLLAKHYADRLGGTEQLKEALAALERLM